MALLLRYRQECGVFDKYVCYEGEEGEQETYGDGEEKYRWVFAFSSIIWSMLEGRRNNDRQIKFRVTDLLETLLVRGFLQGLTMAQHTFGPTSCPYSASVSSGWFTGRCIR